MAVRHYLSWDPASKARQKPLPSRRSLVKLAIALLLLLLLILLAVLIAIGHEERTNRAAENTTTTTTTAGEPGGNTNPFQQVALATHAGYSFMLPDFIPAADHPDQTDLPRKVGEFAGGCGKGQWLLAGLILAGSVPVAYYLGLRRGRRI